MPLRRFRSIRSSPRGGTPRTRAPRGSASTRKVGGVIPLARDEARSLSPLTRLLPSLYPVNTGCRAARWEALGGRLEAWVELPGALARAEADAHREHLYALFM